MEGALLIHPEELNKKWIDRIADAGIATLGIHPWGGKHSVRSLCELVELCRTPDFRTRIDYAHARGLCVEYELHAAGYLLPRELFDTHPEYFRQNAEGARGSDWNFCVSNENALALVAARAADLATELYGSAPRFYFWMDDHKDSRCHCPRCAALSASDQQLLALNAMMRAIRARIPHAKMAYLAYYDSIVLPTAVKPEDGLFLEYAPFEKYTAKGEDAPARIAREQEMLAPLLRFFGKEDAKVLEYWYDNSLFSNWKKPPVKFTLDRDTMERDIALYRAKGFSTVASFACFLGEDYEALHGDVDITPFARCLAK